jgi:hypothetical protein
LFFTNEEVGSIMKRCIGVGTLLTGLLAGGLVWAEAPKSGPQAGDEIPGAFNPLNITGPDAGQKRCQV